MYTVYVLIDPRDGTVRYVGITDQTINRRLDQHLKRTDGNNEKSEWINELILAGQKYSYYQQSQDAQPILQAGLSISVTW